MTEQKTFKLDKFELKSIPQRNQFKTYYREKLTEEEQCIVDNLWNIQSTPQSGQKKITCINFLIQMLITGKYQQKKPFACYVLYSGPNAGAYLTWEEMTEQIEEYKRLPKSGAPSYKGFYEIKTALTSLHKRFGDDFVISPQIMRYQEYQKHLGQFDDQDFLGDIGVITPKNPTQIKLAPATPQKKLLKTFSEATSSGSQIQPQKQIPILGKLKAPMPQIPKTPQTQTGEYSLNTFIVLEECLHQIANNQILPQGISTSWEFTYNPFKICQLKYDDCPENQMGNCLCKLDSATRKAKILFTDFKPFRFQDYPVTITNLLKHALVETIHFSPKHEYSSSLPPFLAETLETIVPETLKNFKIQFTSLYPDFGRMILPFHLLNIFFDKIDEEYTEYKGENESPKTVIKPDEPLEEQIELARAKTIARNFDWTASKFATRNLLREGQQAKIYCDTALAARSYFPFEIDYARPKLVDSYRKYFEAQIRGRPLYKCTSSAASSAEDLMAT